MDGGGKCDICRIMFVTGSGLGIAGLQGATVVGDTQWRERECFNSARGATARVEMQADENGVLLDVVRESDALVEGMETVGVSNHHDLEAFCHQQ